MLKDIKKGPACYTSVFFFCVFGFIFLLQTENELFYMLIYSFNGKNESRMQKTNKNSPKDGNKNPKKKDFTYTHIIHTKKDYNFISKKDKKIY